MHSPTLERLNDGFRRVYDGVNILTIYEMEPTASLLRNESDTWERTGPPVMMVGKDSAVLYWPMETRIGLNQDHSKIAKVERGQTGCYDDICHFLQQSQISTDKANIMPIVDARSLHSCALPSSGKRNLVSELRTAIKNGDSDTARHLVQSIEKGSLAKLRGMPLKTTIQHCPDIVSTLLDTGADVSDRDSDRGSQAIHIAAGYAKSPDIVQLLLDAGANVNAKNIFGWEPLQLAARGNNNPMILQVLIDAGATVNTSNTSRFTPLHAAAAHNNNSEIFQVLIHAGAPVNASDVEGVSLLLYAAQCSTSQGVVKALIKANAEVDATFPRGNSALIVSVGNKNLEICRELLIAGAHPNLNPNLKDKKGCTALHYAIAAGRKACVSLLLEYGADPRTKSNNGVAAKDQKFADSVPPATRNEICELINKATSFPERKARIEKSQSLWTFFSRWPEW